MARIGLLAGEGKLPLVFSVIAKGKGDTVIAFGLKDVTDKELEGHVDKMHWLEWGDLKKGLLLLATERVKKVIMLGKINKEVLLKGDEHLDEESRKLLNILNDKKDYSVLNDVTKLLAKFGVEVMDSTTYLKDLIPSKGTLTKREPTKNEWDDINYGKSVAKTASGFDIGQTIAVKNKTVIAVEAVEGTDETISRAGSFVKGGFVVVKVARPDQDMRLDVPLVGPATIRAVIDAKGSAIALEAKKTLLIDKEEVVRLADENGISVVVI